MDKDKRFLISVLILIGFAFAIFRIGDPVTLKIPGITYVGPTYALLLLAIIYFLLKKKKKY